MTRWLVLVAVTVAVTVPLTTLDVPSAALFAALVVAVALALAKAAPRGVPRLAGLVAQGVLGVYIATMVHRDAFGALGPDWQIVVAVAVGTLALSIAGGAALGMHRDVSPLTGRWRSWPAAPPDSSRSLASSVATTASSRWCSTCGSP